MRLRFITVLTLLANGLCAQSDYANYVNPMIGTDGTGHTFPGATTPFGMVQLSPDTRIDGTWEGCSGYHYSDATIYGFSHTHLSGTGCSDYGDIMLMPYLGAASTEVKNYISKFSHKDEQAEAGFYSVKLQPSDIKVALTSSTRVGFHEYTFPKAGQAQIVLDLNHRDELLEGEVRVLDDKTLEVLRRSKAWAKDQYCYARIEFDKPVSVGAVRCNGTSDKALYKGTQLAICFSKQVTAGETLKVKVALSLTGYEGARLNMTELPHWDFAKAKTAAKAAWQKELSKIEVTSRDKQKLAVFYTALYHLMVQPNIAMDIDHKYRGRDNKIHTAEGFDYYSVFSLWDTYRGAHPLLAVLDRKRTASFVNTFLAQYDQGGRLPVWELASNETDCMIGYHSVSVMADAMAKGITGFDYKHAFEASKHSAMLDHLGLEAYKQNAFIAIDDEHESVSKTLEYAYDDWCIANMAKQIGNDAEYKNFATRAASWINVFDPKTGFMRGRRNGNWDEPFDPREVNSNFTEGNSWQYSFYVPQHLDALVAAHGGKANFERKLDDLFSTSNQTTGRNQVDITGLIGQYAHGNEPSHHIIWLYSQIGKPQKTQALVQHVLDSFYLNKPNGLIGNEDCGQMSAWYVLASMGIYPIAPGRAEWATCKPAFSNIKIHWEDGTSSTITPNTPAETLKYLGIKSPKVIDNSTAVNTIISVPLIKATTGKSFKEQTTVTLEAYPAENKVFYRLGETGEYKLYTSPLVIKDNTQVFAYTETASGGRSSLSSASFIKKPNNYTIKIEGKYNRLYHAGGPEGLLDGLKGTKDWQKGYWQGYQDQDFEAVIDLQGEQTISHLSAGFLQETSTWILMPTRVEFYISMDNVNFQLVSQVINTYPANDYKTMVRRLAADIGPTKARYVKVKAYNYGKLPEWHQGFPYNGTAFIFIDEIEVF